MLKAIILFCLGLLCLIKGGDWFVDGSIGIARRFHLSEFLIGATVVSIGTTLPEVMVSAMSAVTGHGEIAYGNAIGSIICNTALISATTIVFAPGVVNKKTLRTPVAFFFLAAVIYAFIAYFLGYFSRTSGIILLAIFLIYMFITIKEMKDEEPERIEEKEEDSGALKDLGLLLIGGVLIAVGAELLVDNGTLIAEFLGVPESVIALTFVALGTSLPELVTALTSLIKGHANLSLGNIIGANLFNLVLVSGLSITLSPFKVPESAKLFGYNASLVLDIPVMFLVMLILTLPPLITGKLNRAQGIILWLIYILFVVTEFTL